MNKIVFPLRLNMQSAAVADLQDALQLCLGLKREADFVAEVLLYDLFISPVPSDPEERNRWTVNKRQADLFDRYLDIFGDLAIRVPWDEQKRETFKTREIAHSTEV